eukprot:403334555
MIVSCDDGYMGLMQLSKIISANQNVNAEISYKYSRQLTKLRTYDNEITFVNNDNKRFTRYLYSNDTGKYSQAEQTTRTSNSNDIVIDGYMQDKLLMLQVTDSGPQVLSIYLFDQSSVKMQSSIQEKIIAFDSIKISNIQHIYAIQQRENINYLVNKQLNADDSYKDYLQYLTIDGCATNIRVSYTIIAISCMTFKQNSGQILIYQRQSMELITKLEGSLGEYLGAELQIISSNDGVQNYIVYTSLKIPTNSTSLLLHYIEVLVNKYKSAKDQYVSQILNINYPTDTVNTGSIRIAGGTEKLMMMTQKFDKFQGYHFCQYNQYLSKDDGQQCQKCGGNQISLGPSSDNCVDCNSGFSGSSSDNQKYNFICDIIKEELDIIMIIALAVLIFSVVLFTISLVVLCKVKGYMCFKRDEEQRQQELEERLKRRMRIIELKLTTVRYDKIKNEERSKSCSICFEEFQPEEEIRQTQCKHVFHNKCINEWIKTKISDPDCPYCRTKFIL